MRYIDDPVNWIAAILRIQGHGMMYFVFAAYSLVSQGQE
jgi:hypothetical protein